MVAGLHLADGSRWGIVSGDDGASGICSRFAEVMQLGSQDDPSFRLLVLTDGNGAFAHATILDHKRLITVPWTFLPSKDDNTFTLLCSPAQDNDMLASQLMQLSLIIAQQAQTRGGFLLHGALIEKDSWGVILAGPGGVGKTTASRRLTAPWRSLSDDATLVVRGKHGTYWAHPWPTWSNFMLGGKGGTWDVEHAVELKAIFFLAQAQNDMIEPIGTGHSVPLLVELAEQASWSMAHGQGGDMARALRLQRFENICSLATSKICYHLHLSLKGAFWKEIEGVITWQEKEAS
jgi:SynChlorMet cassette protein ScmC